jgi:hypothetical protein
LEFRRETLMLNPEQMKQRCVKISNMDRFIDHVVTEWTCFTVAHPTANPTTGHPHGETARVMIPSIIGSGQFALRIIRSAELTAPDDQRVLKHPAILEILEQCTGRLIGFPALRPHAAGDTTMMIPTLMVQLNELDTPFSKSPSEQAI